MNSRNYNPSVLRYGAWRNLMHGFMYRNTLLCEDMLNKLRPVERYWGYPGLEILDQLQDACKANSDKQWNWGISTVKEVLSHFFPDTLGADHPEYGHRKPYFEVLCVQDQNAFCGISSALEKSMKDQDGVSYRCVTVHSYEEAVLAILVNSDILAIILTPEFPMMPKDQLHNVFQELLKGFSLVRVHIGLKLKGTTRKISFGSETLKSDLIETIRHIRPEIDVFLVNDYTEMMTIPGDIWTGIRRMFSLTDDYTELHLSIISSIMEKRKTPFFHALKKYSMRPVGVFHALAISRGNSVLKSKWIQDFVEFYGRNLFQAESSATCGGLDSLLDPHGALKQAQLKAARAFGADHTFFVTNGTSTANKIVLQALTGPGDIVLIDRNCHKSHHYGMVLTGAQALYLDAYPLHDLSMYGAVPIATIKRKLLEFRKAGTLDKVRLLVLTNCTFDGIVYNVKRVIEECLAIKHDLIFLFDEAWFAYAGFNPVLRHRTAMGQANDLKQLMMKDLYREKYNRFTMEHGNPETMDDEMMLKLRLVPNPEKAKIRVYATQSTHKSLTALRQGSMIHINDQLFGSEVDPPFQEAYYTHTSTSPNYQILASMDVGRSQMELEGFHLVNEQIELAMQLRQEALANSELSEVFRFLDIDEMIPCQYRESSGVNRYLNPRNSGFTRLEECWMSDDEFVLDPTRLTLYIANAGLEGEKFKIEWLMDKYSIQVNKTSRNSVLFQTNIGTTLSAVEYLIQSLVRCAVEINEMKRQSSHGELCVLEKKIRSLTKECPPLPEFSYFHPKFTKSTGGTKEGNLREPFFLAHKENNCEFVELEDALKRIQNGETLVATTFVIPYPPGFPILIPGQVVTSDTLMFMKKLDVKEVHGYNSELGISVFRPHVLEQDGQDRPDGGVASDVETTESDGAPLEGGFATGAGERARDAETPVHIGAQHKGVLGLADFARVVTISPSSSEHSSDENTDNSEP